MMRRIGEPLAQIFRRSAFYQAVRGIAFFRSMANREAELEGN